MLFRVAHCIAQTRHSAQNENCETTVCLWHRLFQTKCKTITKVKLKRQLFTKSLFPKRKNRSTQTSSLKQTNMFHRISPSCAKNHIVFSRIKPKTQIYIYIYIYASSNTYIYNKLREKLRWIQGQNTSHGNNSRKTEQRFVHAIETGAHSLFSYSSGEILPPLSGN